MKKKIALIEDDRVLSNALSDGLKEAGFEVLRAFDGEAGLAMVKMEKPALVLLNILMPKMDGLTVAKQLKSNARTMDIPIIILTVLEKGEPVAESLESGVCDYLVKSKFKVEDIVAKVKEKLKNKRVC
ncbi:MAG: response regulator transcription factor [Candidatus Magasanikbacteria bacterium]|nr:response regulator transcription factor [Candidatus Magasanikbacteria bacterium]